MSKISDAPIEMDLDKLEKERGISRYKAVLMAAKEARWLNDQQRIAGMDLDGEKPFSVALHRVFNGKVVETDDEVVG
ncbi:MAG: DNA-directed RNA polymerase subunit omega [Chitinivibrionia bacterium]|nr:DNA-directed RNA polymerase subunit omega [Chitinivibrionia bacterium]